jgi:predicted HTH transcriptional regulator
VEFKQQLPKDDQTKFKVMQTVCAFANGQGDSLLVGVDDDRNLIGADERIVERAFGNN